MRTHKALEGKADLKGWNQGHCGSPQYRQRPGVWGDHPICTARVKTPGQGEPRMPEAKLPTSTGEPGLGSKLS